MNISGITILYKEQGLSSTQTLNEFKKITGFKKVGHAGTLDPLAEGVLIAMIGKSTRLAEYFQELEKFYVMHVKFGIKTDSGDLDGNVIEKLENFDLTEEDIRKILPSFTGWIDQIPPMYSAIKHRGKRLYKLARKGIKVERKPRKVFVRNIELIKFEKDTAVLELVTGKGVYARQIAVDIGDALGIPAVVKKLVRVAVGDFKIENSYTLEDIKKMIHRDDFSFVIPPEEALYFLPTYKADWNTCKMLASGQVVKSHLQTNGKIKVLTPSGELLAVVDSFHGILKPEKVFLQL